MRSLPAIVAALALVCILGSVPARAGGTTVDNPMRLDGTELCLTPTAPTHPGSPIYVGPCDSSPTQLWWHNGNQLQWTLGSVSLCVDAGPSQWAGSTVFLNACNGSVVQQWAADPVTAGSSVRIWTVGFGWCLQPRPDHLVAVYQCALVPEQHWVGP